MSPILLISYHPPSHRGLTDIEAISNFVHLRFLDVSNNLLTDLSPLASLTQLLWLKASRVSLLSENSFISWCDGIALPSITFLFVFLQIDSNAVASFKQQPLQDLPYLQWLSMGMNKLMDLEGLGGASLESLNLMR